TLWWGPLDRARRPCDHTLAPASAVGAARGVRRVRAARGLGCLLHLAARAPPRRGRLLRPSRIAIFPRLPRLLRLSPAIRPGRASSDDRRHPAYDLRLTFCRLY